MSLGRKPAKETTRSKAGKGYERREKACCEGLSRARPASTPMPATNDRNVKHKHCALDFDTPDCPICLELLSLPVYQCKNGHTACAACRERLERASCPSGSLPIGTNRIIALEKIIESLQVSCKYGVWGCKEMRQYSSKRFEHEYLCKFRSYRCPVVGCDYRGLREDLIQHLISVHDVPDLMQVFPDDSRKYRFPFLTEDVAYDVSCSQYEVLEVFGQELDPHIDSEEDGMLYLLHHQYHEPFCRYSFSCTSFGNSICLHGTISQLILRLLEASRIRGLKDKHSVEGPINDNQTDPELLSKIVEQRECLLVPKLHPAQKDGHEFELLITFLEDNKVYRSD